MISPFDATPFDEKSAGVAKRYNERFEEIGLDAIDEICKEDAFYWMGGDNQLKGYHRGRDSIKAFYEKSFELTEGTLETFVTSTTCAGNGLVICRRPIRATRNGREFQTEALSLYQVDGNMLQSQLIVPLDPAVMDELFK